MAKDPPDWQISTWVSSAGTSRRIAEPARIEMETATVSETTAARAVPGPDQVKLALERTYLAYERTLMAWIRTATSMITFGFGLYKLFFYLHQEKPVTRGEQIFGARIYGICIMGIGVLALVIATWQHRQQLKALRGQYPDAPLSLSLLVATLVASLGVVAFSLGVFRL